MNLVLDGFRVRSLAVIQEEIEDIVLSALMLRDSSKKFWDNIMEIWVSLMYKWWESEDWAIRVLSLVWRLKSIGPRTEPWGTPQKWKRWGDMWPWGQRKSNKNDVKRNQLWALPEIPNQLERRWMRIELLMVSKAGDKDRKLADVRWHWIGDHGEKGVWF